MRLEAIEPVGIDVQRTASVIHHPTATFLEIIQNTDADGIDLSQYVESCRHGEKSGTLRLKWHDTLLDNQPCPGQLIELVVNGQIAFIGVIEAINEFREERGKRSLSIQLRSRDTIGSWRKQKITTERYPIGTNLSSILTDIVEFTGLDPAEYDIPTLGAYLPHANAQLSDQSAWEILKNLTLPVGEEPYMDALGRFKTISRDVTRPADFTLSNDQIIAISGSKSQTAVSAVKLRWLDKDLTKVTQPDQVLATESITAGFFKLKQEREQYWSEDRRARSENTYMKVLASVNDGLVHVGDESYVQLSEHSGLVTVTTHSWVPGLATTSLLAMMALDLFPDLAPQAPFGVLPTVSWGRIIRGVAEGAILLTMMSLGSGSYEIWGTPYDFVHERNTTEAYNAGVPDWMGEERDIENDFIDGEAHAQEVAIRELLYAVAESNSWGCVIRDDLRIEPGDIIELPDQSRLYVTGYERDLTRGAKAELKIEGFRV